MGAAKAFESMFREYDIRGRVGEDELNTASVERIIAAYAQLLNRRGINRAVLGYDNRSCSPAFASAARSALTEAGINVMDIGLAISPLVYYAQHAYGCEGAVMITASHNPNGWSGFKLAKGLSKTLEPEDIKELYALVQQDPASKGTKKGSISEVNARDGYLDAIVSRISMGARAPRIALDAGNGAAGLFAYELFQKLGCLTFQLNCDPDDSYPHYFPNPSDAKARQRLREMVTHPYIKADVGIGFDGDGDRIGVIDENGEDVWSDIILAVLARQTLAKYPGAPVVYDVKCSQTLEEVIRNSGGKPIMWKTGHSYIKAKLQELNAPLGGERSGHLFFGGSDYYGFDDALFAGARLVEFLSHTLDSLSKVIAGFSRYVTSPEIKARCPDEEKYSVMDEIIEEFKARYPGRVNDLCGARVKFDNGWGLVRASSNMPELVLIFEADTKAQLQEIREVFRQVLGAYPQVDSRWENDMV